MKVFVILLSFNCLQVGCFIILYRFGIKGPNLTSVAICQNIRNRGVLGRLRRDANAKLVKNNKQTLG